MCIMLPQLDNVHGIKTTAIHNIHCESVTKNDTGVACYNYDIQQIFGGNIAERMVICFPTSTK